MRRFHATAIVLLALVCYGAPALGADTGGPIQPYPENPWYWEYKGRPLVLIGGSDNDNLFQWTGEKLTEHLDLLVSVGGNYVRNTMSDRDDGDLYAFKKIREGMYDLSEWNDAYRDRLKFFLNETSKRGIIVHLTLWDHFDISGSRWKRHPWNPKNNINLDEGIVADDEDFFAVGPGDKPEVLHMKNQYIERLLELTFEYNHVLYNINNESLMGSEWENYWAAFTHQFAKERGKRVHITSMQFDPSNSVRHALTYPDLYTHVEISQNNQDSRGARGQAHWDNIMFWREKIEASSLGPRPFNNVKVYGSADGSKISGGTGKEAADRLWKNIFAGCASSRFHRPDSGWGLGLNERAQINLKAMSMLLEELDIFSCSPHNDLLSTRFPVRSAVEAYCTADIGRVYAVYFPSGRYSIDLDPWVYLDELKLRWLDISKGAWSDEEIVKIEWEGGSKEWGDRGTIRLQTPSNRPCVALLEAAGDTSPEPIDTLAIVRAYADAMIEHGRDEYGEKHSPLFAEELDCGTMRMLEGESLGKVEALTRDEWGIRQHDRMLGGSNPQHCQNLYQVLFQLTEISGEKRYREEANRSLEFFFEQCQSPATGLFWWGEHAGWDFRAEKPLEGRDTHEFYRPWVLWQRSWRLNDEACERFARGLWEHQIGDHKTGDFSRHARIASHGPGTEAPYARHGGFYIETWAAAYRHTQDEVFLTAIRSVLGGLERARLHEGGMLTSRSKRDGNRTQYSVSLAISLEEAARDLPRDLAEKMRKVASVNDEAFAKAHQSKNQQANQITADWSNAYGGGGPADDANTLMLRYRQVPSDAYRSSVLQIADRYRNADADLRNPVWPGTMGNVILLMLNAYELTSEEGYLQAADRFARKGVELFLADGRPLPKASHVHDHYEAVTNGDTLMMALLKLWLAANHPESKVTLIFTDR